MLTLLLALALMVVAVAGAELTRSTCRRRLMTPLAMPRPVEVPAEAD